MSVVVVPTGTANLASVLAGLRRAGADPVIARDPSEVVPAGRVVLPGVGTFGAAMATLEATGLVEVLRERVREGRPTLAVCVGMQLLAWSSEESPGDGLGVVDAKVRRFDGAMNWSPMSMNAMLGPRPRSVI